MLYHWLYSLGYDHIIFNVFRYISFRSFVAFVLAAIFSIFLGKRFIEFMRMKQFGQSIREDGPESHFKKAGTPTLGGVFIFASAIFSLIICGNFVSKPFLIALMVGLSYFMLGWLDDYLKILKKNSDGVSGKMKLLWQFVTAGIAMYLMIKLGIIDTKLYVPFVKESVIDLGYVYILFGSFVIVGSSNAVNLTDGLDGLGLVLL
jgi:phospho-N-acetylmuramoyl-pentapeptide-transferase